MAVMAPTADRSGLVEAFEAARAAGDAAAMAHAARRIAADRRFGAPAAASGYLHEAYRRAVADGNDRLHGELAVELARSWAYANEIDRAVPFAGEALRLAERLDDPPLLAAALDAELLVHWGPDDLPTRVAAAARLEGLAGRLTDVEPRLSAAVWRLTTALETLDAVAVRRQLRTLDDLARESGSPRVAMFAASRRGMHALLTGDLAAARRLVDEVRSAGEQAHEPDAEALVHVLVSAIARQAGDLTVLADEAAAYEAFGADHGVRSVLAEAATLWLAAGDPARAGDLLAQVAPDGFAALPRDVDWLLTVVCAAEVAAGTGARDVVRDAVEQLTPYAGRGVVNAGAVAFAGVVDDVLALGHAALGQDPDRHAADAAIAYRRIGARWWSDRLAARTGGPDAVRSGAAAADGEPTTIMLAPAGDDVWLVGPPERPVPVRASKGLRYLRLLLARPHVEVSALDLSAAVNGAGGAPVQGDLGDVVDRQALTAYRQRLADLDAELTRAREWADHAAVERLVTEREFLLEEIGAATGLRGRPRRQGGDAERARVAVQKALAAAIRRVADADPRLGRLLQDSVRTGSSCCYDPDPARAVHWVLDVGQR